MGNFSGKWAGVAETVSSLSTWWAVVRGLCSSQRICIRSILRGFGPPEPPSGNYLHSRPPRARAARGPAARCMCAAVRHFHFHFRRARVGSGGRARVRGDQA